MLGTAGFYGDVCCWAHVASKFPSRTVNTLWQLHYIYIDVLIYQ